MAGLYHGAGGVHGETWGWIGGPISPHPFRVGRGDYWHTPPGVETPGCLPGPLRGPALAEIHGVRGPVGAGAERPRHRRDVAVGLVVVVVQPEEHGAAGGGGVPRHRCRPRHDPHRPEPRRVERLPPARLARGRVAELHPRHRPVGGVNKVGEEDQSFKNTFLFFDRHRRLFARNFVSIKVNKMFDVPCGLFPFEMKGNHNSSPFGQERRRNGKYDGGRARNPCDCFYVHQNPHWEFLVQRRLN